MSKLFCLLAAVLAALCFAIVARAQPDPTTDPLYQVCLANPARCLDADGVTPIPCAGEPIAGIGPQALETFCRGQILFARAWTEAEGLGPLRNRDSCMGCHRYQNGTGSGFGSGDTVGGFGPATAVHHHVAPPLACGGAVFLQMLGPGNGPGTPVPPGYTRTMVRRTPTLLGLGFVEATPGIVFGSQGHMGTNLFDVVEGAFLNELGLTQAEAGWQTIDDVAHFIRLLATPTVNDNAISTSAARGLDLMRGSLQCTDCHVETMVSGDFGDVPQLRNAEYQPWSDFAMHDMGDCGTREDIALGSQPARFKRTIPFWDGPNNIADMMGDGVPDFDAAMLRHCGEAAEHRQRWFELSENEKSDVGRAIKALHNIKRIP